MWETDGLCARPPSLEYSLGASINPKVYVCVYTELLVLQARLRMCNMHNILCVLLCEVCPPPPLRLSFESICAYTYLNLYACLCMEWLALRALLYMYTNMSMWVLVRGAIQQHTATQCNMLQRTVSYCNTLQYTATHYRTLQCTATHTHLVQPSGTHHTAMHYKALHLHTMNAISMSRSSLEKASKSRERVVCNSRLEFGIFHLGS